MKKLLIVIAAFALLWGCKDAEQKAAAGTTDVNFPVTRQEIFALSMVSNLPAAIAWPRNVLMLGEAQYSDSIIMNICPLMDSTLKYASDGDFNLKNWTRVWGPAVISDTMCELCTYVKVIDTFTFRAHVPVSSMTIFQDKNNNFVVGIEATNPSSITDWVDFDLDVFLKQVPFDGNVAHGNLTNGTANAINNYILQLKDIWSGKTAIAFLDSQKTVNSITVTGHSLGGALSPVYALYLQNNMTKNNKNIYCLSTAGASPGDTTFVRYFDNSFPNRAMRIWNSLDVVPHAWEPDTMNRIDSIYYAKSTSIGFDSPFVCTGLKDTSKPFDSISTPGDIQSTVSILVGNLASENLVYGSICNGGTTFKGTQLNSLYFNTTPPAQATSGSGGKYANDGVFIDQLGNQHVAAYSMYFGIVGLHRYMHNWVTGKRVKNSAAWWNCEQKALKCKGKIPYAPEKGGKNPEAFKDMADLWGQIHKAAWKW